MRWLVRRSQRGSTLIELIVVGAIVSFIAVAANKATVAAAEESLAVGTGTYLDILAQASQRYALNNFTVLSSTGPVTGTVSPLAPTLAELRAFGLGINPGFPDFTPTRQQVRIDILRSACPGPTCALIANVCTTTGIRLNSTRPREDLALIAMQSMSGRGGISRIGSEGVVRGSTFSTPNPVGNVASVVCAQNTIDTSLYNRFVTIRDTRDPDLQGSLTVAGPTVINNSMTVTGTVTAANLNIGDCIKMDGVSGRAGFSCRGQNDLPTGYTGGVRSADVVADRNVLASSNPSGFTGANGNYAMLTADNGTGAAEIRTSGRTAGDRLTPTGQYVAGSACAAADEGSIARRLIADGGLVHCKGGVWQPFLTFGDRGQACSPDGATGVTATGIGLYCQSGFWTLLADRFGRFAVTDTYLVQHGSTIPKPTCPAGSSPKVYFNPQGVDTRLVSPTQGVVNFRAEETSQPGFYTISVDVSIGANAPQGAPTAGYGLAVVGCYYQ